MPFQIAAEELDDLGAAVAQPPGVHCLDVAVGKRGRAAVLMRGGDVVVILGTATRFEEPERFEILGLRAPAALAEGVGEDHQPGGVSHPVDDEGHRLVVALGDVDEAAHRLIVLLVRIRLGGIIEPAPARLAFEVGIAPAVVELDRIDDADGVFAEVGLSAGGFPILLSGQHLLGDRAHQRFLGDIRFGAVVAVVVPLVDAVEDGGVGVALSVLAGILHDHLAVVLAGVDAHRLDDLLVVVHALGAQTGRARMRQRRKQQSGQNGE